MHDDEPERLDRATILALRALRRPDGTNALSRLVPIFLSNAETNILAARAALAGGDLIALNATAHAMKSSSGSIGAPRLASMWNDLDTATDPRLPPGQDVAGLLTAIKREFALVADDLRAELGLPG